MKTSRLLPFIAALVFLAVLPSCSSGFRQAWKTDFQPAPSAKDLVGKWEGTWQSEASGHHGKLRCVVSGAQKECKVSANGDHVFFYHATWKSILSGSYKAVHKVQRQQDGSYSFKGQHKMPDWAGGLYHYAGTIKGDDFQASYRCAFDHGTYTMKRVR